MGMANRLSSSLVVAGSIAAISICAVVIAQPGPPIPITSPGYVWGRTNCNPATNPNVRTYAECAACCSAEFEASWHTPSWLTQCLAYCASVNWSTW